MPSAHVAFSWISDVSDCDGDDHLINPIYDPARRQITVNRAGEQNILQKFEETEWSIYSVSCRSCGQYGLRSKFSLKSGTLCPLCRFRRLQILKRFADSREMRDLISSQKIHLWQFIPGGQVVSVPQSQQINVRRR